MADDTEDVERQINARIKAAANEEEFVACECIYLGPCLGIGIVQL